MRAIIRTLSRWQTILQLRRSRPVRHDLRGVVEVPIRQIRTRGTIEGAREAEVVIEGVGKAVEGEAMAEGGAEEGAPGRMTSAGVIRKLIWVGENTSSSHISTQHCTTN